MPWSEQHLPGASVLVALLSLPLALWWLFGTQWWGAPKTQEPRGRMALPEGKVRFRPGQEWKEVLPEHLLPPGLDVRFDLDGGRNFARLQPGQVDRPPIDSADEVSVEKLLSDAATWGQQERVQKVLQSCYYRLEILNRPLAEAAGRGHIDVCKALLAARGDPLSRGAKGVTPLHRTTMEGHEELATLLLQRCIETGVMDALARADDLGRTCLDCAEEQDLHAMARRLKASEATNLVRYAPELQAQSIDVD